MSSRLRAAVDKWARLQEDRPSRSEAVRRLVELALSNIAPESDSTEERCASLDTHKKSCLETQGLSRN